MLGYVEINVTGPFCERFITLCGMHSRDIWDIRRNKECVTCFAMAKEYKNLRYEAKMSGSKLKISKKYGLPFLLKNNRHRRGIFVGLLLSLIMIYVLSGYVWNIDITGNSTLSSEAVKSSLSEFNVYVGMKKKNIDPRNIKEGIMAKYDGVSWMSINPVGTTLSVNISERVEPPQIQNNTDPCNIVAKTDGVIKSIKVTEGKALVKVGDAVLKGDVLISGIVEYSNGSVVMKQARGEVVAICEEVHSTNVPLKREILVDSGQQKTKNILNFFNFKIPLYIGELDESWEKKVEKHPVVIDGVELPLGITKGIFTKKIKQTEILSVKKAVEIGKNDIKNKLKIHDENSKVELISETVKQEKSAVKLTQKFSIVESIGISEKVLIF